MLKQIIIPKRGVFAKKGSYNPEKEKALIEKKREARRKRPTVPLTDARREYLREYHKARRANICTVKGSLKEARVIIELKRKSGRTWMELLMRSLDINRDDVRLK